MIFGFNTDVKHGDTVYHVQSEAREHERVLQTQVFVRGRCIGKQATSYAHSSEDEDFSEKRMEEMLRTQHKAVLEAVREGRVESVLGKAETSSSRALKLQWLNADSAGGNTGLVIRLAVTEGGAGVRGAEVTSRVEVIENRPLYAQAITDANGQAELRIAGAASVLNESPILVQATHEGRSTTRKFRLRKQRK